MLNVSLILKESGVAKETPIICYIRYNGTLLKYPTGEKIEPKHWNTDKHNPKKYQRAKSSLVGAPELNSRLESIITTVKKVFGKYQDANDHTMPNVATLKDLLNLAFKRSQATSTTFMVYFAKFIEKSQSGQRTNPQTNKSINKNTIKTYQTTFNHLTAYEEMKKRKLLFDDIDQNFYDDYKKFLIFRLCLSTNSVGKDFQIIKVVMNEATDTKVNQNQAYKNRRFITVRENTDSIYLNVEEIAELAALDLSADQRLENVRDMFLIGCYTGLRYSDYSRLSSSNFVGGYIEMNQTKTGHDVTIPIHRKVQDILNKYNGQLPRAYSNQKMNKHLKEIGSKLQSLQTITSITITKGGATITKQHHKYELLTTHTARRSFATNLYLAGRSPILIMSITGHRTEKAFLRYIKVTRAEHAKVLKMHWDELQDQKAV